MGDENQILQEPKPDWIASAISGQIKNPSELKAAGLKASDFNFENADTYWKTPVVQEHFKNDKNSFINFYAQQKSLYDDTKKSDYELDFNVDVATDKWSRKPLIGFSTKSQIEDPFGRNNFGDYYSPAKFSEREQAINTGVKIGNEYVPITQYNGEIKLAKDEFGAYKRDERNRTYWEPVQMGEELKSYDETYSSFAHNMGIYGLKPNYFSEGFYTAAKAIPNFINRTSDSLLELPRILGADVSGIQSGLRENLMPSSDRTRNNFLSPMNLAELGLDSVMQLFSMGVVGNVAGALSGSAKTASVAGRIYMTGMAAGPMAQISRENNLSPVETAILYGANAAAIYKLSGLSDMIVRGIRPIELEKIIAPKLAEDYGVTIAKKGFTESALKSFQNRVSRTFESALISLSSKPYVKTSFLEGIEEMGEQTVDSGIRGLHNIMAELLPLQGRFQWDLGREVEAILQSGAGGAFGGAIAHPILKKLSNYDRELVDSFEAAVAFNDEGVVLKMINDWEKAGRLSKDGKTGEENTRNATALKEILSTMTTIRDRAGIADAIKNNEKKAGIFADVLKASSIGRDKIILQNELATLTNQLDNAAKADNKELIENLTKEVEAKKAQIAEFNSGSQVARYITEGLYNVESNPSLKSTVVDSSDLGIEALKAFNLTNDDHFNGKLFALMNIDSKKNKNRLTSEVGKRNQELIENSAKVNLENFESMDITKAAKQRLLDEANIRREAAVKAYKDSGVENVINDLFADDEDFDAAFIHSTSPENSFRFSQEVLKSALKPYQDQDWYSNVAPVFEADELIKKINNSKRVYETSPEIEPDSHIYYDFENGKSTVSLSSKLEELRRAAGYEKGLSEEERNRLSGMFISSEPQRLIQVIDDRIKQVLGNYALKNKKGYKEIIDGEVSDTRKSLEELLTFKGQFLMLKTLSDENENNTDVRILQIYIASLRKQFEVVQNFVKKVQLDFPEVGKIFGEHEVEMQEALDKQDYVAYRRESLQVDKKLFDTLKGQKGEILQKLQKSFSSHPELMSESGILAKNTFDYARAVLSNDATKFVQAAREVIADLKEGVKTPTREHQMVAELALRNAMAGYYDFRVRTSSAAIHHLSYTSSINGGPGVGKTVTVIPLIAGMVNKMTGGNVIVTAYKDSSGKKIQKVRSDVEKFFGGKPDFIQHSDSKLIDMLKSDEIKNVSAIIFDEAALMSVDELTDINQQLLKINESRSKNPLHIFYTYDEFQNGYREKNSQTTYSITSPTISVPSTPRLTFSFRSVNSPLKALENALRNSQFTDSMPSSMVLNYDKNFNGVRFVNSKEELESVTVELASKLKNDKNLSSMVYINADIENTAVPAASAMSLNVMSSVESQGDEWDYVVVDTSTGEMFGNRNQKKEFYTAVTRAKKGVIVYVSPSMPAKSIEGIVKEFKPITPPEISQETMLAEIDNILQNDSVDASFNPADTMKPPSGLTKTTVEVPEESKPVKPAPTQVDLDEAESSDYRRVILAMTNPQNRVLLNTFYDVAGEQDTKRALLFDTNLREKSTYQVTIAKIGSQGYVVDSRIDSSKMNGQYAIFLEGITPNNNRAVLGVIYLAGGPNVEATLRNLNIIKKDETRDVVATYPVSNNILRSGQFFHPFIFSEKETNETNPDGSKKYQKGPEKTFSEFVADATSKGIGVSPVLIATHDIKDNRTGKISVQQGEPFVALSYKYSPEQMASVVKNKQLDVFADHVKTVTLNRKSFSLDEVTSMLSPFYSRNEKGYLKGKGEDFEKIYYSFWQSPKSKGKRKYEEIFKNVKEELSKKDPQVKLFLQKYLVEHPVREVIQPNGKRTSVGGEYSVSYLLHDYVQSTLETNPQKLLNMNAEPKRKLMMAMMANETFSKGLRFSPSLQFGSSGLQEEMFGVAVQYNKEILDNAIFVNYFDIDLPKIQIPIESLLSEISYEKKEAAPVQTVGRVEQQPAQKSVQGPAISATPVSLVEFTRREFPTQPALARKAIETFKRNVIASHLQLSVPKGGTPQVLDANTAMMALRNSYLSNGIYMSKQTNTESKMMDALGRNFNGLLAQYFPAIKYNAVNDEYYYGNDLSKSGSFAEKEMEYLLGDGINSIVKTYLYNTQLRDGSYITPKHISNVLKLIKETTNAEGEAIRSIDDMAQLLGNSNLPEAQAIYDRFFSKSPKVIGNNFVYSTRSVETPAGQNLTNSILMFLNKGQVYTPGFINVNIFTSEFGPSSEQRVPKLPLGGFNPEYIKTQFLDKFESILRTSKISFVGSDLNFNGQLFKVENTVSPENAMRMIRAMGFEGFTPEMLNNIIASESKISGQLNTPNKIQDYFFKSVKNYNKNKTSPSLQPVINAAIEHFISSKGLGNNFSFKDGTGKKQYGLRDSAPIFHTKHVVESAKKSPLLQTNLLANSLSGYSISQKPPFTHLGFKINKNGFEYTKSVSDLTVPELLDLYLLEGYVAQIESGKKEATFPVTVYADSGQEISPIFESANFLQPADKTIGDLFDSRTKYYTGLEFKILNDYKELGISARSLVELNSILGKVQNIEAIVSSPNMVSGIHYNEKSTSGPLSIKPELLQDVAFYMNPENKQIFTNNVLADAQEVIEFSKVKRGGIKTLYNQIKEASSKATPEEFIKTFYANWLLFSSEFQNLMNGPKYQYKESGQKAFIDMVKRSKSLISPESYFILRNKSWESEVEMFRAQNPGKPLPYSLMYEGKKLPRNVNVLRFQDPTQDVLKYSNGQIVKEKWMNGATLVTPFTRIMQNYSSALDAGPFVGPVMKNITHSNDFESGTKSFVKNAEFEITPHILRDGNEFAITKFIQMTSAVSFPSVIQVNGQPVSNAYQLILALGMNPDFSNAVEKQNVFEEAMNIMVDYGYQDYFVHEAIFQSSEKTGQRGVNDLSNPNPVVSTLDITMKGIQQDGAKDPSQGMEVNVLTQLVNAIGMNWVNSPALKKFYDSLSEITKSYIQEIAKMDIPSRIKYFTEIMRDDILATDGSNYRTDAASVNRLSINDRTIAPKYTQTIATNIKDAAVAFGLQGGHFVIHPSLMDVYDVEEISTEEAAPNTYEINNPAEYTNHSGGALGADSIWDDEGRKVGVVNHQHYYYGNKTPKGNVLLTKEQLQEGIAEMRKAAVVLGKNPQKTETINLLARNWFQVKNSEQIVAVAPISEDMKTVEGGTGWAVAMGQANNREIHVFNQKDNNWYTWNGQMFVQSAVPVLKKNFAGIGTRQITEQGKQAIRDVYANTFGQPQATQPVLSESKKADIERRRQEELNKKYKVSLGKESEYKDDYYKGSTVGAILKQFEVLDENGKNIGKVVVEVAEDKSIILHPELTVVGRGYGQELYKLVSNKFNTKVVEWTQSGVSKTEAAKQLWNSLEKQGLTSTFEVDENRYARSLDINKIINAKYDAELAALSQPQAAQPAAQSQEYVNTSEIKLDKPRFNPDNFEATSYPIKINGKYAGVISVDKNGYISSSIGMAGVELEKEFQGKGYGTKVYIALAEQLAKEGKTLKSEAFGKADINKSANRVWKSLLDKGYAIDKGSYFEVQLKNKQQAQLQVAKQLSPLKSLDLKKEFETNIGYFTISNLLGTEGRPDNLEIFNNKKKIGVTKLTWPDGRVEYIRPNSLITEFSPDEDGNISGPDNPTDYETAQQYSKLSDEEYFNEVVETQPQAAQVQGVEISSNAKGLAAALTNPTELAKQKGNLAQSYPVNFRGKQYADAEEAYQALKATATKDEGPNSTYNLMVEIIKAKLEQHPRLSEEITKQGGSTWILASTHQPTNKNTVWETGGKNWFIKALNEAYQAVSQTQPAAQSVVAQPVKKITVLKSQLSQFDPNKYQITQRKLKWQDPVREDGVSLTQLYASGLSQEAINQSLKEDNWSKGFAEILLPAEMMQDFELDDVIAQNIPIDAIDEKYFLNKLLTKEEFDSRIIPDVKKKRAKLMYDSFRVRLEGIMARIPTSGKHSAISTVIAGFFQGSMNSVMVPAELYTVQGADQDYDKGSYVTYQSIKEYTMIDPNVKNSPEVKTFDPNSTQYSHLVVKNVRPTGLIPFESNLEDIKSVKHFSKSDLKAIEKIAVKNEIAKGMNSILSDSKSLVELNTTSDDVMTELRNMRDIVLDGASAEQKLRFDHLMSLLKIHELNQAGGKNLVGIFANGAKAYNVLYLSKRMAEIKKGIPFSGEADKIWENYAALISAAVDNANEGVLGPLAFDQITAPYISYLVSTGMSMPDIARYVDEKKAFFDAIRKSKEYNSPEGFNINDQALDMQRLYLLKTEWDVLSQGLTNRDIPITMEDISAHILSLENYVNLSYAKAGINTEPFDFERFFSDDSSYAQRQVGFYNSLIATGNHQNNILEIFDNAPHMRAYQQAIAQAHSMFKDIKAYTVIYNVNKSNLRNSAFANKKTDKVSIRYRYQPDNFLRDYNTVHGMYVHAYLNSRDTSSITAAKLGTPEGRAEFIKEVNNSLLNLKSKYPDNEFVKDLMLEVNDFTKESKIRMYDFYDMNDDLKALYMEEFQKLDDVDRRRLFIYNLIVTRDKNSKGSFTSLFSITDKSDYINFLDYEVNIPLESFAQVVRQEETLEESGNQVKTNSMAIPYSGFSFEKNPPKVISSRTVITKGAKEAININYVSYIDNNKLVDSIASVSIVDNKPVIKINWKAMESAFLSKRWTSPQKLADGTYSMALPYHTFASLKEYEAFNIEYQYLAFKNPKMPVNEVIQKALINIGKNKFVPYRTNKEIDEQTLQCSIKEY